MSKTCQNCANGQVSLVNPGEAMSEFQAMNAMFKMLRGKKMDRWGPSETCEECGQACSWIDILECGACEKIMCRPCKQNHVCEMSEPEENDDAG